MLSEPTERDRGFVAGAATIIGGACIGKVSSVEPLWLVVLLLGIATLMIVLSLRLYFGD